MNNLGSIVFMVGTNSKRVIIEKDNEYYCVLSQKFEEILVYNYKDKKITEYRGSEYKDLITDSIVYFVEPLVTTKRLDKFTNYYICGEYASMKKEEVEFWYKISIDIEEFTKNCEDVFRVI